jgi:fucose permease
MIKVEKETTFRTLNTFCYVIIGVLGVYISAYQNAVGAISLEYHLTPSWMGLVISLHFAGSILLPAIMGAMGDRTGARPALVLALAVLATGLVLILCAPSPIWFAVGSLLVGGGFAVTEGMLTSLLAMSNPEKATSVLNLSQMFFCLGAVLGPFLNQLAVWIGIGWRGTYGAVLLCMLLGVVLIMRFRLPRHVVEPRGAHRLSRLLKSRLYLLLMGAIFLYVGVEEGTAFWITSYVATIPTITVPAYLFLSSFWLGMGVGRLLSSRIRSSLLLWSAAGMGIASISLGYLSIGNESWILLGGLFLSGFGLAPVWPVLMMEATTQHPDSPHTAGGGMMSLAAAGGMAVPLLMGRLATGSGMTHALRLLPLLLLVAISLTFLIRFSIRIRPSAVRPDEER